MSVYTSNQPRAGLDDDKIPPNCINNITVDNLIFAVENGNLKVLLVKYSEGLAADKWGLIGHWVQEDENLDSAAVRVVKTITGVDNLYLDQLAAFGNVDRYPIRRTITVVYYSLVRMEETCVVPKNDRSQCQWFDVRKLPELMFDHRHIMDKGLARLQYKVRHEPIGFNLLPEKFTLLQLQEIYEAILNKKFDKPNFRRKILKMNFLIDCKEKQTNVAHRAASLYRFDNHVYEKLREFGFTFEY
ncbi:NUDIX hydrolase [Alteromonas oceanisediminis]|uniref:NUDIX hydrolase n=1 Tax=Alteromonas oceanisediminis TaxID=2836180 RepID=UPI001BD935F7|nr:NUDIX domain-containing protein [Alteromonas oceanisediminis]MBT0586292.1 NUDIX hydrolase [Alteromonas oceanisediminis]